jgi:hypothetical protein
MGGKSGNERAAPDRSHFAAELDRRRMRRGMRILVAPVRYDPPRIAGKPVRLAGLGRRAKNSGRRLRVQRRFHRERTVGPARRLRERPLWDADQSRGAATPMTAPAAWPSFVRRRGPLRVADPTARCRYTIRAWMQVLARRRIQSQA